MEETWPPIWGSPLWHQPPNLAPYSLCFKPIDYSTQPNQTKSNSLLQVFNAILQPVICVPLFKVCEMSLSGHDSHESWQLWTDLKYFYVILYIYIKKCFASVGSRPYTYYTFQCSELVFKKIGLDKVQQNYSIVRQLPVRFILLSRSKWTLCDFLRNFDSFYIFVQEHFLICTTSFINFRLCFMQKS